MVKFDNHWDEILAAEFEMEYYLALRAFLKNEYRTQTIYPDMYNIFHALKCTDFPSVRAVILGQDPYHGEGQAHGLAFSVQRGVKTPPSLVNIYKELETDLGIAPAKHGNLEAWARGGVLLLNTALTVRAGAANSHRGKGWETFTDHVIAHLNQREEPMVFLLWGANAKSKMPLLDQSKHLVLTAAHPSPLSAHNGFFGCKHFSKCNAFLRAHGQTELDWRLPD